MELTISVGLAIFFFLFQGNFSFCLNQQPTIGYAVLIEGFDGEKVSLVGIQAVYGNRGIAIYQKTMVKAAFINTEPDVVPSCIPGVFPSNINASPVTWISLYCEFPNFIRSIPMSFAKNPEPANGKIPVGYLHVFYF